MYHKWMFAEYTHNLLITNKLLISGPNFDAALFQVVENPLWKTRATISNGFGSRSRTKLGCEQIQLSGKVFAYAGAARFMIPNPDTVQSAQFVHKC